MIRSDGAAVCRTEPDNCKVEAVVPLTWGHYTSIERMCQALFSKSNKFLVFNELTKCVESFFLLV
jgi:hypothetical protein